MTISLDRARELVGLFSQQHILVVGDLMLDRYVYGTVARISPEAPVPVVHVTRERVMPGGASNAGWNIRALGGAASMSGWLGEDPSAAELRSLLNEKGVGTDAILTHPDLLTTEKIRVVAEQQQVVRVDRERIGQTPDGVMEAFCERVGAAMQGATAVILEDYGKGVMEQPVVDTVLAGAEALGIPVGFDPKDNHSLRVDGVTIATPNRKEAFHAVGAEDPGAAGHPLEDPALLDVASELYAKWGPAYLLITLGPQGILLIKDGEPCLHRPTRAREVFDVSGAGDTVISSCMLTLAAGGTAEEAADIANYAAGVVVAKLGTATCTADELLAYLGESDDPNA